MAQGPRRRECPWAPDVNLELGAALRTAETNPLNISRPEVEGLLGLDIDLPLERTAERNAFRAAVIQAARARRQRQAREDGVVLQVRQSYRRLDRARRSYDIQAEGARLADRRVESTNELLEAGRANTRDRLEAEDDRVLARGTPRCSRSWITPSPGSSSSSTWARCGSAPMRSPSLHRAAPEENGPASTGTPLVPGRVLSSSPPPPPPPPVPEAN